MTSLFNRNVHRNMAGWYAPALLLVIAAASLGACTSIPAPTEQLALAKAAVADAASADGTQFAPAEMRTARDKLDGANAAMVAEDHGRARLLAEEAQVDAHLAQVKAQSMKARKAADALTDDNRVLLEEINRNSK